MGVPVTYGSLEINLLKVITHDLIYTGNMVTWHPNPGDRIIDLAVWVVNTGPSIQVQWNTVGIIENGKGWYPNFVGAKSFTTDTGYDPFNLKLSETNGNEFVRFDSFTCLRLVFFVKDDPSQIILFQIENSPLISFQVK
jgi:hypothetical protein